MIIGVPRETASGERRVALTPDVITKMEKLGHTMLVEPGAGTEAGLPDAVYAEAGASLATDAAEVWAKADVIAKVRPPETDELSQLSDTQTLISFFYPGQSQDLLDQAKSTGCSVIAMDMVPRISRAQKMDALSELTGLSCLSSRRRCRRAREA